MNQYLSLYILLCLNISEKHDYTTKQRASHFRTSMKDTPICTSAQFFGTLLANAAGDAAFSMVSADEFSTALNVWERVIVPAPTFLPPIPPPSRAALFQQSLLHAVDLTALSQQVLIVAT